MPHHTVRVGRCAPSRPQDYTKALWTTKAPGPPCPYIGEGQANI